jgi:hypothetical protein
MDINCQVFRYVILYILDTCERYSCVSIRYEQINYLILSFQTKKTIDAIIGGRYDSKSCFQYVKLTSKRKKKRKNGEKKVVYHVR